MKTIITLSLLLAITGADSAGSMASFWQSFKTAVTKGDVETIARLSKFPLAMSYGIPVIKTKAQLTRRYKQVFKEQTDAAACFAKAKPEIDAENSKHFTIACPDAAGNEVVIYHFRQTATGWKFTGLDNLNE